MKRVLSFVFSGLILLSFRANALTFSAFRDTTDGSEIQKFVFKKGSVSYTKTSNFFDVNDDYRLGTMNASSSKELAHIEKEITELHNKLEKGGSALKRPDTIEMSDLNGDERHAPVILLGGHKLSQRTVAYKTAYPLLIRLLALKWNLHKGIHLTKDGHVEKFSGGRKISSELKQNYFRCKPNKETEVCSHLSEILYVK